MMGRERGSSLYSALLTPKPPASSVYVRVPEARCPHTRSIPVTSLSLLSHYGVSIQGPCRPASQAQRRPSGCPESRTAGAGLSAGETIESSSASHGPRHGGARGHCRWGCEWRSIISAHSWRFRSACARKKRASRQRASAARGTARTRIRVAQAASIAYSIGVPRRRGRDPDTQGLARGLGCEGV
jgi:hypothetical protein